MSFPWKIFPIGFLTVLKGFKHFFNFFLQYFQHSGGVKRKQWQQKELILKNEISKIGELLTTINIWYLVWTVNEDWENTKINNRSVDKKPCQRIQYKASLCKAGRRRPQLNQESLWYLQFSPHVVNHTDLVLSSTSIGLMLIAGDVLSSDTKRWQKMISGNEKLIFLAVFTSMKIATKKLINRYILWHYSPWRHQT